MPSRVAFCVILPLFLLLGACSRSTPLDDAALRAADQDSANWVMYGRTYDDHRYSPLVQISWAARAAWKPLRWSKTG
jgi:hypothetical protein